MDGEEDRRAREPCDALALRNEFQEGDVRKDRYCENKGKIHRINGKDLGLRWAAEREECFGRRPLPFTSRTRRAAPSNASAHRTVCRAKQSNQITTAPIAGVVTGNGFTLPACDHYVLSLTDFHGVAKFIERGRPTILD